MLFENKPSYLVPYKRNPYSQEMKEAAIRILERGHNAGGIDGVGKEISFFEEEFATYFGKKHAIMLNSCLNGLYLLLQLHGVSGGEVISHTNIEPCDATCIVQAGAKPAFVDIEAETLNMDVTQIEAKITDKTKAIFPVHAHGHPTDMGPVLELAEQYNLYVIEDFTHCAGAKYRGKQIPLGEDGSIGLQGKGFWLPGGGAMVVTDNTETMEHLKYLRSWAGRRSPEKIKGSDGKGIINSLKTMPNDLDAAIGRIQLRNLDEYVRLQRLHAKIYSELLEGTPITLPEEKDYGFHVFLRYVIQTEQQTSLQTYLKQYGVDSHVIYPTPAHMVDYFQEVCGYKKGDFPVTEKVKATELALPEPRPRTQWELEYVTTKIKEFFAR